MQQQDPIGEGPITRDADRGTVGDDGREAPPIPEIDPDDLPVAPGLELAGGDRVSQEFRRARAGRRWATRPPSRADVNRAGSRDVLAAIDAAAPRPAR
jgi:hypothetical protein